MAMGNPLSMQVFMGKLSTNKGLSSKPCFFFSREATHSFSWCIWDNSNSCSIMDNHWPFFDVFSRYMSTVNGLCLIANCWNFLRVAFSRWPQAAGSRGWFAGSQQNRRHPVQRATWHNLVRRTCDARDAGGRFRSTFLILFGDQNSRENHGD